MPGCCGECRQTEAADPCSTALSAVYRNFDWFHFIADGHGVSPFLTRILELYCNLRYGTAFANPPIPCSPAYDIAKLVEQYPLQVMDETTMQREVVDTCEEPMHRIRIRFAKKDLVAKGVQNGVKPFCALMGLLCIALGEYLGKDTIQYSYSADTRDAVNVPDALYNCTASSARVPLLAALPSGVVGRAAECGRRCRAGCSTVGLAAAGPRSARAAG